MVRSILLVLWIYSPPSLSVGIYFVLFVGSCYLLFCSNPKQDRSYRVSVRDAVAIANVALYALITAVCNSATIVLYDTSYQRRYKQWVIEVYRVFRAFIDLEGIPADSLLYIVDLSDPIDVGRIAIFEAQSAISDAILVSHLLRVLAFLQSDSFTIHICRYTGLWWCVNTITW